MIFTFAVMLCSFTALVLVFLCLVKTHLCGRLNLQSKIQKRLTPPRLSGINRLFHAFPRGKFIRLSEPASRRGLKQVAQQVQDEAGRSRPKLVQAVGLAAAAATAGASVGVGSSLDWDVERLREGMRNVGGTETVPSLWEFMMSGKSYQHGNSPAPPPPPLPQEEEKNSDVQSHNDEELAPLCLLKPSVRNTLLTLRLLACQL